MSITKLPLPAQKRFQLAVHSSWSQQSHMGLCWAATTCNNNGCCCCACCCPMCVCMCVFGVCFLCPGRMHVESNNFIYGTTNISYFYLSATCVRRVVAPWAHHTNHLSKIPNKGFFKTIQVFRITKVKCDSFGEFNFQSMTLIIFIKNILRLGKTFRPEICLFFLWKISKCTFLNYKILINKRYI